MARQLSTKRLYQLPPDITIISSVESPARNRIDITVETPPQERICPHCGSRNCIVKDSGRLQTVRHLPVANRSVFVTFRHRRFLCKDCRASYYEPLDWVHDRLRMTNSLVTDICLQLTEMVSIHEIAKLEHVTDETVTSVFNIISIDRPSSLPKSLCVDEFKGETGTWNPEREHWDINKFHCNITDGSAGILIDVLPAIKKDFVADYFMQYPLEERRKVKYFCCDMHSGFISIGKACFPDAIIRIDLFHVVNRLNMAMDAIRRRTQDSLLEDGSEESLRECKNLKNCRYKLKTKESSKEKLWGTEQTKQQARLDHVLGLYPEICEMHDRLQEFLVIIDTGSYARQRMDFSSWLRRSLASEVPEIRSAAATLQHWRGYIQNSWKYGQTNGPCEGINNKVKVHKRISYGVHNFDNFRKRLLLICGPLHLIHDPAVLFRRSLNEKKGEIQL